MLPTEYQPIKVQFDKVLKHNIENCSEVHTDELFEDWYTHKKYFLDKFGGPIYEYPEPLKLEVDPTSKATLFDEFLRKLRDLARKRGYSYELYEFCVFNGQNDFYENKVSKPLRDDIPVGTKLIKAFKHFISDKEDLREFQDLASLYIQKIYIEGTLCLSVHPLDFLTVSVNNYNWTSCHSLTGCYKAGNLAYMSDESTFIAYIKGKDNATLPNFPADIQWNDKKWRVYLYLSNKKDMVLTGRQYPFTVGELLNKSVSLLGPYFKSDHCDSRINLNENQKYWLEDTIHFNCDELFYFDVTRSEYYNPMFFTLAEDIPTRPIFYVGEEVVCPACGLNLLDDSSHFICEECRHSEDHLIAYCESCGCPIYDDTEFIYDEEEECYYCEGCW